MTVYRVGRKVGRTIYRQTDERQPADGDELIGMMDTRELAAFAVEGMNAHQAARSADSVEG